MGRSQARARCESPCRNQSIRPDQWPLTAHAFDLPTFAPSAPSNNIAGATPRPPRHGFDRREFKREDKSERPRRMQVAGSVAASATPQRRRLRIVRGGDRIRQESESSKRRRCRTAPVLSRDAAHQNNPSMLIASHCARG
jgi:hypothetical protein